MTLKWSFWLLYAIFRKFNDFIIVTKSKLYKDLNHIISMVDGKFQGYRGVVLDKGPGLPIETFFLSGDVLGREVREEYEGRVEKDFGGNEHLKNAVCPFGDGNFFEYSNIPGLILLNQIIKPEGLAIAQPSDIQKIICANDPALSLGGYKVDLALVLGSENGPNENLAKKLADQLRKMHGELQPSLVTPLTELKLKKDQTKYGFNFELIENPEIFYVSASDKKAGEPAYFTSDDIDIDTGLPAKTGGSGNRRLYMWKSGLSRFYLDGSHGKYDLVCSEDLVLPYSNSRIIIVKK